MKKYIYIIIVILTLPSAFAQDLLTAEDALKITLENNYDIKVIEKDVEIAKNNTSIYNSDYLPTANVNAGTQTCNPR